jgi:hypothetical protein
MEDKNSSKERIMVELTTENTRVKKIQSGVLITRTNKLWYRDFELKTNFIVRLRLLQKKTSINCRKR